jgi:hypothetical protein
MGRAGPLKPGHKDGHPPIVRAELPVDTVSLARHLIGKILVRELPESIVGGRIVETEAYVVGDAAGHAEGAQIAIRWTKERTQQLTARDRPDLRRLASAGVLRFL